MGRPCTQTLGDASFLEEKAQKLMIEALFKTLDDELGKLFALTKKAKETAGKAQVACKGGQVPALSRQLQGCSSVLSEALSQVETVRQALEQTQQVLERTSLEELASEVGERVGQPWLPTESPHVFVAFPALVRFSREGVRIDRKLLRSQRPSAIAEKILRARMTKGKETNPEVVLERIWKAAKIAAGYLRKSSAELPRSLQVPARDVFEVLHLNNPDYTEVEFTRHLYLLDRNGTNHVEGYRLIFSASTGTRSGRYYRIRDEAGVEHAYYLLEFEKL